MDRRTFLKAGLGAASLAATPDLRYKTGRIVANTAAYAESILHRDARQSPIDTVVIMMLENRSFDHYFGWLAGDERYMEAGRRRYGKDFRVDANHRASYPDPKTGQQVATYHLPPHPGEINPYRGCGHPDPGHGPVQGRAQRDRGFIGRDSGNDAFALGYYEAADLPLYNKLVRNFTTFDRYHASILSSTYPNRLYLQSAQCGPTMDPPLTEAFAEYGFDWRCIWDNLLAARVSCANYCTDVPTSSFFGLRALPIIRPIAGFFADAATGRLPHVSMVDPGILSGFRTDDHPLGDMRAAQAFAWNIVSALQHSPQWHRTALIITYDEWGGFFDHVRPPQLPDNRSSSIDSINFGQAGFRVPVLLVSPYAQPGYVDHRVYDHSSILRFLEWRFLGAPAEGPSGAPDWSLTERDAHANNIGTSLRRHRVNDYKIGRLPRLPVVSTPCTGTWFQDVPGLNDPDRAGKFAQVEDLVPPHALEQLLTTGWLERMNYRVRPSMSFAELVS
jgi:phospholipase C